jgi:hypothetical protein
MHPATKQDVSLEKKFVQLKCNEKYFWTPGIYKQCNGISLEQHFFDYINCYDYQKIPMKTDNNKRNHIGFFYYL